MAKITSRQRQILRDEQAKEDAKNVTLADHVWQALLHAQAHNASAEQAVCWAGWWREHLLRMHKSTLECGSMEEMYDNESKGWVTVLLHESIRHKKAVVQAYPLLQARMCWKAALELNGDASTPTYVVEDMARDALPHERGPWTRLLRYVLELKDAGK